MMCPGNRFLFLLLLLPGVFLCPPGLSATPEEGETLPFFGVALDGYPLTHARLSAVEEELGLQPDLVVFFLQWPPVEEAEAGFFPGGTLQTLRERGAIPCVTWEPMYFQDGREWAVPWQRVLDGSYDPYLVSFAEQAGAWGKPFVIRLAHEMNIARYHWGTAREAYGPESPAIYRRLFRYIVDLFDRAGAHNVLWAFCPNAESVPSPLYDPEASWNRAANYYPGDAYVDILGMDGYNWGTTRTKEKHGWDSRWKGFREIFSPLHCSLRQLAPEKPMIVFETSTAHQGGDRRLWIEEAGAALRAWRIQGMAWFQVKKEQDWRLQAGEARRLDLHRTPRTGRPDPLQWMNSLLSSAANEKGDVREGPFQGRVK